MIAPTLATQRLTLRAHEARDFDAYADLWAGDDARFMGGPLDRNGAWGAFCSDIAAWSLFGFGGWAVDLTGPGTTVGQVVINRLPAFAEPELGWLVYRDHRGRGYATEAAARARRCAYQDLGLTTLVSYVDPANAQSIAVAERLGGTRDAAAGRPDPEDLVFRYPGPEALQ